MYQGYYADLYIASHINSRTLLFVSFQCFGCGPHGFVHVDGKNTVRYRWN